MASLYITEFAAQSVDARGYRTVMAAQPPVAEQVLAIGASSVASAAFNPLTAFVRLTTDVPCSISLGTSPTATASKGRMSANSAEYFGVPQGQSYKVAVITNS